MDVQSTFARKVRLSAMSLMSSESSLPDFFPLSDFPSFPFALAEPFDSLSASPVAAVSVSPLESEAFSGPSSFSAPSAIGLLGSATTVEGSAVSRALRRT